MENGFNLQFLLLCRKHQSRDSMPSTSSSEVPAATTFTPTELAPEDKAKIEELKQRLGIVD